VESIRPWSATMAESRDAPALSARGSEVQNVIDGWVWRQIGKSSAPRHRKHSDNRDHLLSAQRSGRSNASVRSLVRTGVSKIGFIGFSTP
jgi:hypothetical protein